jgi:hypothetical protein
MIRAMSVHSVCPSCGEDRGVSTGPCPGCGADDDDLVLGWVSSGDDRGTVADEAGCPTCGFAGDLIDGPEASACPACLAEYPKAPAWRQIIRCPNCNLAIGISDENYGKTIVCSRCKCFVGSVLRDDRRTSKETSLGWVKQVPTWVWLLLAGWQLNKAVGTIMPPLAITTLLPYVGVTSFLVLASCRVWLWRKHARQPG